KFIESLDGIKKYHRSCYNLIINPANDLDELPAERRFSRDWAVFDMFPTILASIGCEIEGDRLGIGTNLFSDRDTVFEEFGVDYVNDELVKRSNFYNFNILIK
ncbi:MAG: LTA synthase family protein, partial [Clostridia bacterium]|nr:LTA synthase family protein [Clostridia bacterium]